MELNCCAQLPSSFLIFKGQQPDEMQQARLYLDSPVLLLTHAMFQLQSVRLSIKINKLDLYLLTKYLRVRQKLS